MRLDVIGKQGLAEQLSLSSQSAKFEHTDSHICCEKMPKTTFGRTAPLSFNLRYFSPCRAALGPAREYYEFFWPVYFPPF